MSETETNCCYIVCKLQADLDVRNYIPKKTRDRLFHNSFLNIWLRVILIMLIILQIADKQRMLRMFFKGVSVYFDRKWLLIINP